MLIRIPFLILLGIIIFFIILAVIFVIGWIAAQIKVEEINKDLSPAAHKNINEKKSAKK